MCRSNYFTICVLATILGTLDIISFQCTMMLQNECIHWVIAVIFAQRQLWLMCTF